MRVFLHKNEIWVLSVVLLATTLSAHLPSMEIGGFQLMLSRVLLPLLGLVYGSFILKSDRLNAVLKGGMLVLVTTFTLAGISFFWSGSVGDWIKEMFFLLMALSAFLALIGMRQFGGENAVRFQQNFLWGLKTVFLGTCALCAFEMLTSSHLVGAFTERLDLLKPFHHLNYTPVAFFGNPNNLALFVTLCAGLFVLFDTDKKWHISGVSVALLITGITEARLAFACTLVLVVLVALKCVRREQWPILAVGTVFFLITIFFSGTANINIKNYDARIAGDFIEGPIYKKDIITIETLNDSVQVITFNNRLEDEVVSSESRMALLKTGINLLKSSEFVGVGAGQFEPEVVVQGYYNDTGKLVNPHSFVMRVLAELGIVGFLIWTIGIVLLAIKIWRTKLKLYRKWEHLIFLGILLILSNVPSSFISLSWVWVLLAFWLIALADELKQASIQK